MLDEYEISNAMIENNAFIDINFAQNSHYQKVNLKLMIMINTGNLEFTGIWEMKIKGLVTVTLHNCRGLYGLTKLFCPGFTIKIRHRVCDHDIYHKNFLSESYHRYRFHD